MHFLAYEDGTPVATLRVTPQGDAAKIERVAVLDHLRGTGVGAQLVRTALEKLKAKGFTSAKLGSQLSAIGFYEKLGFVAFGPEFDDAGIPHRMMTRDL